MTDHQDERFIRRGLVALVLALAASPTINARAQDHPPVTVATTEQQPVVELVGLTGTVNAIRAAQISPAVSGQVSEILAEVGDRVSAGAPLLRLDRALTELELRSAEAAAEQAREALADARRRLADAERLAERRGIAATEVQALRSEVRADAAALRQSEAEAQHRREALERHTLRAPFDGVVSARPAEVGEWLDPGDSAFELVATDRLLVDFPVPQRYFPDVQRGRSVEVMLESAPAQPHSGRIEAIVPVSDGQARTFLVRVALNGEAPRMTPGMSATGRLRIRRAERGVVVSRDALMRYPDGRTTVWVTDGGNELATVREQPVETGLSFDGKVHVIEGLEPGTEVVVEGNEGLQPGQTVSIHGRR